MIDLTGAEPMVELAAPPHAVPLLRVVGEGWEPGPDFRYRGRRLALKVAIDRSLALIACVVLAPVALLVALAVRCTSRGPVLFRQQRIGRRGQAFEIIKFRTMRPDAERVLRDSAALWARYIENDFKLHLDEDPRVTRLGRFLRRSSLDELPQLWNVLKGEMSLVGPRPVVATELDSYGPWVDAYLEVYPGLTGVWQVEGRNDIAYPERAMLDARYAEEWSIRRDLSLLARTVPVVLRSQGVS